MKRTVILTVDDPEVTHLGVDHQNGEACLGDGLSGEPRHTEEVPVPPDDQLTRDLDFLTWCFIQGAATADSTGDKAGAAFRVRAAAGLGERERWEGTGE